MRAVRTIETDHSFGPPLGQEDEILDLPCTKPVVNELGRFTYSVWEPNESERVAIARGCNLRLGIGWLGAMPPVSLGITHLGDIAAPGNSPWPKPLVEPGEAELLRRNELLWDAHTAKHEGTRQFQLRLLWWTVTLSFNSARTRPL